MKYLNILLCCLIITLSNNIGARAELVYHFAKENTNLDNIRIASYNMRWLSSRIGRLRLLYNNRRLYNRKPADKLALSKIINALDADIIALQEIDDKTILTEIFSSSRYNFVLADSDNTQRPGFAIAKHIDFVRHEDIDELSYFELKKKKRRLRRAVDISVHLNPTEKLRLLSVHLKAGCYSLRSRNDDCIILVNQFRVLANWVSKRIQNGENFMIIGDINRRLFARDPMITLLQEPIDHHNNNGFLPRYSDLLLPFGGRQPQCWQYRYSGFIDHFIAFFSQASRLAITGFGEYLYADGKFFEGYSKKLSDHCPIFIDLSITTAE